MANVYEGQSGANKFGDGVVNRVRLPRMYTALMHYGPAQGVSRQGQRKWSAEGSQRITAAAIPSPISNSGEKSERQHRRND